MRFVVGEESNGIRADLFLVKNLKDVSRRFVRRYFEEKLVRRNGSPVREGEILKTGDTVTLEALLERATVRPAAVKDAGGASNFIEILHEDDSVLVVLKKRAMPSVVHESGDELTVADCIVSLYPACRDASPDIREGGLVQRLDYFTTGAMLVARNRVTWERLREELLGEQVEKSYLALVEGEFEPVSASVNWPLRQSRDGTKMEAAQRSKKARGATFEARTKIERIGVYKTTTGRRVSLVRCWISRARRHQVRAHLSIAGYPLVGDELYGSKSSLEPISCGGKKLFHPVRPGFFLHAERIVFEHPKSRETVEITAPNKTAAVLLREAAAG